MGLQSDVLRKRYLSFGAGYHYITSLTDGQLHMERRWVIEVTSRFPLPENLLVVHRSRDDIRVISSEPLSSRYREKLQLERDFKPLSFVFVFYVSGELYYDTRHGMWNRNRYSVGLQVPAGRHLVSEAYYLRQNDSKSSTRHVNAVGISFNLHF
jgi:hypothetical protein